MTTITKERVAEIIHAAGLEPCDYEEVFSSIKTGEIVAMARIALASLEAEPVLYAAEETIAYARQGELHLTCLSEPMGDAVIPLFAAQPVPVAVPDEVIARLEHEANHLTAWHHIDEHSCKVYRRDLLTLVNACRAAMLQGAENIESPPGIKPAPVVPEELLSAMEEVLRISDRDHEAWHKARNGIVSCRAALLQGSQPVSNRDELPPDEIECDICGHVSTDPEGRHYCCEDNSND